MNNLIKFVIEAFYETNAEGWTRVRPVKSVFILTTCKKGEVPDVKADRGQNQNGSEAYISEYTTSFDIPVISIKPKGENTEFYIRKEDVDSHYTAPESILPFSFSTRKIAA